MRSTLSAPYPWSSAPAVAGCTQWWELQTLRFYRDASLLPYRSSPHQHSSKRVTTSLSVASTESSSATRAVAPHVTRRPDKSSADVSHATAIHWGIEGQGDRFRDLARVKQSGRPG